MVAGATEGMDAVAAAFRQELAGKHAVVVKEALTILIKRFATDDTADGYRKDGPVAVARFELGEGEDAEQREARQLRQRQAADVIEQLVKKIG